MSTLRKYYWVSSTESKIYHSKPNVKGEVLKIGNHTITKLERFRKVPLKEVLPLLAEWRENYIFAVYAMPKYEIIDCPELLEIQKSHNLENLYVPYRSTAGKKASLRLSEKKTKFKKDIWKEGNIEQISEETDIDFLEGTEISAILDDWLFDETNFDIFIE